MTLLFDYWLGGIDILIILQPYFSGTFTHQAFYISTRCLGVQKVTLLT